jgi:CubicO group peptidase (beta-lactamase class C family)
LTRSCARRRGFAAAVGVVVLLVAGCGGGADEGVERSTAPADDDVGRAGSVELQSALDGELAADEPGCVVAVGEDGEVIAVAASGVADLESGEQLSAATVFDFASVSKQLTGALITVLADAGALGLDDPLSAWLDDVDDWLGAVTVRQLLHHTSGLPDYTEALDTPFTDVADNADVVAWLRTLDAPSFPPGSGWDYTNTGYVLLAEVAAAAGGAPFEELMRDRVLEPAGTAAFVRDYRIPPPDGTAISYADGEPEVWRWNQQGDGGVHGTAADLIAWGHELATGEVLGAAWRDLMVADPADTGEGAVYGHGIFVDDEGFLSHDGGWQAFATTFVTDPGDDEEPTLTWVALCNRDDLDPRELLDAVLARTELPMP